MIKTVRATLIAFLLGMATGAIFAIVPAAFAQDAIDAGPSGSWSGYYNHGGWSGYYDHGAFNGTIGPQGPDAIIVQGTPVVEESHEQNGHWILLSLFVVLLLYRLISFRKFLQVFQQNKSPQQIVSSEQDLAVHPFHIAKDGIHIT